MMKLISRCIAVPVVAALVAVAVVTTAGVASASARPGPALSRPAGATVIVRAPVAQATAAVGDEIMVDLVACAASCGYTWKVTSGPAAAVAKYLSTKYWQPSTPKGTVGGNEIEVVIFKAVGAGSTTILFKYFPPGRNRTPTKAYKLSLKVG